ncbi:protein O-GlcNAcase [Alteribacillus sp. HJP-4]|uniref:protein O-GlcNAcase n=1 Tax=Alteribacillus sp. HJP-4 TaxID=2775394 RepID=UPI0035CD11FA
MTNSPFDVRGVIEGFYGVYYTFEERNDLLSFLGRNNYNLYIYGPKNDRQHRAKWREPYPEYIMSKFLKNVNTARDYGVEFCYSLGPGVSMVYSSSEEMQHIKEKFISFFRIGVRSFSLLLDDIPFELQHKADIDLYQSSAEAHAAVCNNIYDWLKGMDSSCSLSMCPTDYAGPTRGNEYLPILKQQLHPEIDMFFTGPDICSKTISTTTVQAFRERTGQNPVIWDNYPVNDLAMSPELHIGPIRGRDDDLYKEAKGFLVNPMNQPEASKIPLLTFADYFNDPHHYQPESSWNHALKEIAGKEFYPHVKQLAENSLHSCLGTTEAEKLECLTKEAVITIEKEGIHNQAVEALEEYLDQVDHSCFIIKNWMDNTALRNDLLPWIEVMEHWYWMTKRAIIWLRSLEEDGSNDSKALSLMEESLQKALAHPKKIGGSVLIKLAELVQQKQKQTINRAQDSRSSSESSEK